MLNLHLLLHPLIIWCGDRWGVESIAPRHERFQGRAAHLSQGPAIALRQRRVSLKHWRALHISDLHFLRREPPAFCQTITAPGRGMRKQASKQLQIAHQNNAGRCNSTLVAAKSRRTRAVPVLTKSRGRFWPISRPAMTVAQAILCCRRPLGP